MRFAKTKAMLSVNALKYTIEHLLRVAFPTEKPLPFQVSVSDAELTVVVADAFELSTCLLSDDETRRLRKGTLSVGYVRLDTMDLEIPVFKSDKVVLSEVEASTPRSLRLPFDFVTLPFLLLSKSDERDGSPRDSHGRFRFTDSIANAYDFVEIPLVDAYALLLRQWVLQHVAVPFAWTPRTPRIVPTHDIDLTYRFHSDFQAFKSIFGRDLLIEHSLHNTIVSYKEFRNWKKLSDNDPYLLAIRELKNQALNHKKNAVFFFKAQQLGEYDATYDVSDARVGFVIRQLVDAGMTIGLHGSYGSLDNAGILSIEKERLEKVTHIPVSCGRQHYLRFNSDQPLMIRAWQNAGIEHDYTLGYAERAGFRCGTCHPFPLYDVENDCPTNVVEHPLIVMDGTLIDYMKLDVEDSAAVIRNLRKRCADAEGDFVFLWHNHTMSRGFRKYYERCVESVY